MLYIRVDQSSNLSVIILDLRVVLKMQRVMKVVEDLKVAWYSSLLTPSVCDRTRCASCVCSLPVGYGACWC